MRLSDSIRFYAATDVGKVRDHNEDNFLVDKKLGLFIVADGMGGHAAGEVASAIAVRTVHEEVKREKELLDDYESGASGASKVTTKDIVALVEHAVQRACSKIHEESSNDAEQARDGHDAQRRRHRGPPGLHRARGRQPHLPRARRPHPAGHRGPHGLQ